MGSLLDALLLDPAPFEVWVSFRTDNIKGSGTASDPWNGSTQPLFDAVMSSLPTGSRVHLGPGTFETRGYPTAGGWKIKPRTKITGSGVDVTTLKLVQTDIGQNCYAIGHDLFAPAEFAEISDLTIDSNLPEPGAGFRIHGAIRLLGNHVKISRVKALRWGAEAGDLCVVFSALAASSEVDEEEDETAVANCGIEHCVAVQPSPGHHGHAIAFHVGGVEGVSFPRELHGKTPYLRHCFVDGGLAAPQPGSKRVIGLSMGWCRGGLVEGNQVQNADIAGPYQIARSVRDLIVRHNVYRNVAAGIVLNGVLGSNLVSGSPSLTVSNGVATISGGLSTASLAEGDRVKILSSPSAFDGMYVIVAILSATSFTVATTQVASEPVTVTSVQKIFSVTRAIVERNIIELPQNVSGISAVAIGDNGATTGPDYLHGDIVVRHNEIRPVNGGTPLGAGEAPVQVNGAKNVHLSANLLETASANPIQTARCGSVKYFDNRSAPAGLLAQYDPATGKYREELDIPAEDALVMACLSP